MSHPRRGGTGMSWTRLLSLRSRYFWFSATESHARRLSKTAPTAACPPASSIILREKVMVWWTDEKRRSIFTVRASTGRSAKQSTRRPERQGSKSKEAEAQFDREETRPSPAQCATLRFHFQARATLQGPIRAS